MQKTAKALRKPRGAFLTCFLLGLILVVLAAAFALYANATKVEVFQEALAQADVEELLQILLGGGAVPGLNPTKAPGGIASLANSETLGQFAQETIDYLVDKTDTWAPTITVMGFEMPIPISDEFMAHMDNVKGWVDVGQKAFYVLLGVAAVLLLRCLTSSRRGKSGFSAVGYYLGVFLPLALVGGIIGWAYFDFDGFWMFIHEHFIRDGIFSNGEVIMQIFTTDMFKAFIQPIVTTFALLLGGVVVLPVLVAPLCRFIGGVSK